MLPPPLKPAESIQSINNLLLGLDWVDGLGVTRTTGQGGKVVMEVVGALEELSGFDGFNISMYA